MIRSDITKTQQMRQFMTLFEMVDWESKIEAVLDLPNFEIIIRPCDRLSGMANVETVFEIARLLGLGVLISVRNSGGDLIPVILVY